MHELVKNVIEKHLEKHKEVLEYLNSLDEPLQVSYNPEHIQMLVDSGHLSQELGYWFFRNHKEKCKQHKEIQEFIKNNPDISEEERCKHFFKEGPLTPEETAKSYEDMALNGELLMCLLKNRHLLTNEMVLTENTPRSLFNNLNHSEEFGISNCISNSLYHLEGLLKNMEITQLYDNFYDAKGSITNTSGEAINLNFSFPAANREAADKILDDYKYTMKTQGLKVWFAHWQMANKLGRVEYACPMIEIMKLIAEDERESPFSVKEKQEHWKLTKMLRMSILSRERKIKKRGTGTEIIQWIEQPLVEIIGGEKEITDEDKYPLALAVRVLMPKVDKKGFAPSIYRNKTILLNPSDMFLAFKLQTRATQMDHGNRNLYVDWDFIFEAGNLQTTALSNHRGAKAKAKKKMDRLQKSQIIEEWNEDLMGQVCITPKKQKRMSKKEKKTEKT